MASALRDPASGKLKRKDFRQRRTFFRAKRNVMKLLSRVYSCISYLKDHKVRIGQGWFGEAGLAFAGTPGMSVGRIHREAALAEFLAKHRARKLTERLDAVYGAADSGVDPAIRRAQARSVSRKSW